MARLSSAEINAALAKIRVKYNHLIRFYHKPPTILDNFEERYLQALKNKMDLSIFLMAEIDVVGELISKEELNYIEKQKEDKQKKEKQPTFADKVFEDNRKKILKYPRIKLTLDADEELEYLMGAVRTLINNYWPAIIIIFKDKKHTQSGDRLNDIYNKLLSQFDYTGSVPITRHYVDSLNTIGNQKKIDYEHRFIMQETAFLLNDIADLLKDILEKDELPEPEQRLLIENHLISQGNKWFTKEFQSHSNIESFQKVMSYLEGIILDFRLQGIKKRY
ncbi:MAG: hypothetical protein MJB14_04930 [Spirochaetes bacterium]|nr:hypothetical protein [Spirochaetota bacterium]